MNSQSFKNVFSKRLGCLVAVGEHASSQGKANGASVGRSVVLYAAQLTAACVLVSMAWAGPAGAVSSLALPSGGQLAQGVATVQQAGAVMNINQSTSKAVMNWNSFDIGTAAKVNIVQPGASAVMLNRVTSANSSQILGQLNANGQVVLVNPNGLLFGKDGSVNASSFTASTLGITDANFMAGNQQFERNGSTASVVNQGSIKTSGGYVALLGASVSNEGLIQTQGGVAYLAAAETVRIPVSGSGRIKLELSPSRINAAVANTKSGTIVTEGGQVYMQAAALNSAVASILQSGSIDTTGEQGGAVHLLADGGQIKVDGSIITNSAGHDSQGQLRKGGDIVIGRDEETGVLAKASDVTGAKLESLGGFVETSGDHLITAGVSIKAKDWLLDPTDINIVAAGTATADTPSVSADGTTTYQETAGINTSEVLKSTIESAINGGTNVTISTANSSGGANGAGNITIGTALSFTNTGTTDATLTLSAKNGITQNAGATITTDTVNSTKLVNLTMTAEGKYMAIDALDANSKGIILNSTINTNGQVTLDGTMKNTSGAGVHFGNGSGITASKITVTGDARVAVNANSFNGIVFNGTNTFVATGVDTSLFLGKSSSQNNLGAGIMGSDAATVRFTGKFSLDGQNSNAGYRGVRLGAVAESLQLFTNGNVTFQDSTDTTQVFLRGTLNLQAGTATLRGGSHVDIYNNGTSIIAANGTVLNLESKTVLLGEAGGININTNGDLNAGYTLNIKTNRLDVRVNAGSESTINVGTGNSNISTYTSGKEILIGSDDVTAGTTKLGLTNAELTRFNGQKLVIGDMVTTGIITVAGATTTNAATGNVALQTAENIAVNAALSVGGAGGSKDLTLNAGGATSTISQSAAIKATSLELLGVNAAYTLSNTSNAVGTLAGNAKSITFSNVGALSIGAVNTTTGVLSSGDINITTTGNMNLSESIQASGTASNITLAASGAGASVSGGGNISTAANNTGQITVNSVADGVLSGVFSGGAGFTKEGAGKTTLTNANTFAGVTTITAGALQVGNGGTSGSIASSSSVTNNASLIVNRSDSLGLTQNISGTGALTQAGTGTTTLTGANTYSGTTTISAGTLQVGNGGASGTLGSGALVDNAALVFNRDASADLTVSSAISGTGTVTQSGAGKTILTGGNSYSGTTTINTGTLQVGSGGATGTLGSGGVSNNAALIFNRNATTDLSVSNAISGTGSVEQAGAGKTILSTNNSYSGAASVSGGILQVGNGGATGTLGTANSVALSNNATLAFNKNVNTSIDKSISGNGNVTANITGDLALSSDIALTGTNTINLTASGSITRTAGSLAATNLYLTATTGSIGTNTQRIQSNVNNLYMTSAGNQYVSEETAVTLSARTTSNGSVDVVTTLGTLTVGTVNSVAGISTNGTGNVTLSGTATAANAGIMLNQAITGNTLSLTGTANGTGNGIHNAGSSLTSLGAMTLTGTAINNGAGIYSFAGTMTGAGLMTLSGVDNANQGLNLHGGLTITNTGTFTAGQDAVWLKGSSSVTGVSMNGVTINNNSTNGITRVEALNGRIDTQAAFINAINNASTAGAVIISAGNGSATSSGAINVSNLLTITQNSNAGVVVSTSGTGNVTSPKIINAGTGDIVVAAGSLIGAGTETGGQILTVAGNTLAQTNGTPGKTYVYSGAPSTTGVLSNLSTGFNNLYYQGTSAALNAGFGQGFDANHANDMLVPGGGSASGTQVFFRTATKPSFSMTLSNNNKAYGATDPVGYATTSGATLTNAVAGVGGNNTFAVTSADVLAGLTGGRTAGENVGSYAYSLSTGNFNTTLTAQPNLVIGRRDITLATLVASNKVYDGSTLATITSGTFGNLFNGETLLISGQGAFDDKNVADGKTVTVADVSTLTKANGTGNWSNYNLTTTSKTTTANITKATLTVTAIDDGKIVTQADPANFLGVRVDGLKLGDAEADVIAGLNISRTNAVNDTAAGTYLGVLVPTVAASVNYDFLYVNGNYTIVPARQLLVRTTDHNVVYGSTPTFDTTAAYLDAIGNPITNLTRTGTSNNYTFNDGAGTTVTLALKPYNGSSVATLSTSGNTVVGSYNVKDLAYSQTGSNFLGTPVFVGNLSVTPKAITPSASGVSKVYDATTSMANVVVGMTGKITNDVVTIGGTGAFSQPTVGSSLGYAVTGVSLTSTDAGNYFLANGVNSFSGTDGEITRAALVATANSRTTTFNGAAQSVTGFTVAGLLGSDSEAGLVGISASGATGTNVGTYANTMTVANQTNYTVTGVNGALTIDPAPILATDISAALRGPVSKVYDGTTAATLTPANYLLTGWLGSDGATVSKTLGAYNNANVGVGKTVTVSLSNSDYQATGATNLSNYSLPSSVSGTVGVITKKDVTLTGFTAANKVYDGNTLATITASNILTGVGSETLSVRGTANFSDKNVGVSKLVSISDSSALVKVDGTGQWTNYNLLNSTATTTANITLKLLQASGLVADKVYDGTAQAALAGSAGVGVVTGDTVFLQAGSALFADKHVSRDATGQVGPKTVTVSGLALAGADAGNYVLSAGSFQAQAKITPRILDLQVSVNDKPYDGTTTATARVAASNLIAGDAVQWDLGAGFFASKDVSRNQLGQPLAQQVNFDNLQMTGLDSGNYSLPFTSVRTSASITPKVLTLLGSSVANKNVDGNTDATVTLGAVQGLVGAEQLAVSVSGRFQTATPGGNKPVDVKYSWSDGANGGKASNYALPDDVLLASILSPQNDAIKPILPTVKPTSGGGSVTIVAAQPAVASNLPASLPSPQAELVCTVTDLEPCDCEKTVLDGLDICLVPRNTQASRGKAGTSENGFTNRK